MSRRRGGILWVAMAALAIAAFLRAEQPLRMEVVLDERVALVGEQGVQRIDVEDYLTGVLACEMPARYDAQALRAQAVCARTRLVYQRAHGGCGAGEICTRSAHCQGYLSKEERAQKWGADATQYEEKLRAAVRDTRGEIMTYAGEAILTLYHASSGGATEDVEHVFAQSLPYLRGVESPETDTVREVLIPLGMAYARLDEAFPQAALSDAQLLSGQVEILTRYASGRVETVRVGETEASGREVRTALGLRSAYFDFTFTRDALHVTQLGYGHGVGMSQEGAQEMALSGADYRAILSHYYTGIQIGKKAGT